MDDPEPFKIALHQNSMRFLDRIAYDKKYGGFANATEEGERLAQALKDKDLLMMGQHGVLVIAKRACDAFDDLYYLERAAEIQVHASSQCLFYQLFIISRTFTSLSQRECKVWHKLLLF